MEDIKRPLTEDEIQDILNTIIIPSFTPVLNETYESIQNRHRGELKKQLSEISIYPDKIAELKTEIERSFRKSLIEPGESVGMIAGQSIGERQTQTTLNSVDWTEKILIIENGYPRVTYIGEWIDRLMAVNKKSIKLIPENRTQYLELNYCVNIISVDDVGTVSWERVTAVTRHLPVGKLLKVQTFSGRNVKATRNKSFLTVNSKGLLVETEGTQLKTGDKIPVIRSYPVIMKNFTSISSYKYIEEQKIIPLTEEFGTVITAFMLRSELVDMDCIKFHVQSRKIIKDILNWCTSMSIKYKYTGLMDNEGKHPVNIKIYSKFYVDLFHQWLKNCDIPPEAYVGPTLFAKGILKTFFYIYGKYDKNINSSYLKLTNRKHYLKSISTLLCKFGVISSINEDYLAVPGNFLKLTYKQRTRHIIYDVIESIEDVESTSSYVYDLTIPTTKNFCLLGGIGIRDTFHSAGLAVKTVVTGVPRFTELLSATKKQKGKMCTLYFKENKPVSQLRKIVGNSIVCLTLKDIVIEKEILYEESELAKLYFSLFETRHFIITHGIRFKVQISKLFEYSLKMKRIKKKMEKNFLDLVCVHSTEREGILEVYINTSNIKITDEWSDYIEPSELEKIYLEEFVLPEIEKIRICGIEGIEAIFYREEKKEWIAETEGTNLKKLLALDILDSDRIYSNDLWEIYNVLGIEAARQFLIEEYTRVLSADGTSLNPCHIKLVADIQTFRGITTFSRYGMRGNHFGPLVRSSFEVSVENFVKAGMYSEEENMKGVSASIICGIPPKTGSGICDLKMDLNSLGGIMSQVIEK